MALGQGMFLAIFGWVIYILILIILILGIIALWKYIGRN